ncbi:hypothetical protein LH435_09985 [Laribacter hongkongensis]|uniref:hypothetical protein n=1 Tax=Laribacter hongkongensis TaxID=168471 RepID=UPI001EFD45C8|nr:hypothetical protein [Laribacter hongkongensis]MCG9074325.1 hypothetical protein [Laribacter hongkongensis]
MNTLKRADELLKGNAPGSLRFFAYDDEVGFERFNTEAEAKKSVQESIDEYRAIAAEGWPEEVENLCWGVVLGTTKEVPLADSEGNTTDLSGDRCVDYTLTDYTHPAPVNQQMLEALKELRDAYQEFMVVPAVKANAAIAAAEASGQENHQAEPVAGQCKFSCESKWLPCSVEHHYHVLSCPDEWPGYETRLLYTAPQPSSPPGWKLVPVEPTSKMIVAGAEADPQFFTHAKFVYRAMLAAVPEQEGGA